MIFFPSGSSEQNYLNDALAAFNTRTGGCVKWIPRTSETNYVAITSANTGCWSYVGLLSRGRQELNLQPGNPGCLLGTSGIAEHEMLHSLGTWHEQSRPDRLYDISHKCCQKIIAFLISGISMSKSILRTSNLERNTISMQRVHQLSCYMGNMTLVVLCTTLAVLSLKITWRP